MTYIFGKLLNKKKCVHVSLVSIFGLGKYQTKILCNICNIGLNCKIMDLSQNQIIDICKKIDQKKFLIESQLKNIVKSDIKRLINIRCFRGFFHQKTNNVSKK